MILSFFSETEYITDNDQSENPDCIAVFNDVDFDHETQIAKLVNNELVIETVIERDQESKISDREIWNIILDKNFSWNINAQLSSLSKVNIKILYSLSEIIWKDKVKIIFSDEIALAKNISDTRVECWLSPYDLSSLD